GGRIFPRRAAARLRAPPARHPADPRAAVWRGGLAPGPHVERRGAAALRVSSRGRGAQRDHGHAARSIPDGPLRPHAQPGVRPGAAEPRGAHGRRRLRRPRDPAGRRADMSEQENKQRLQRVFAELANGNARPFVDSFADDVRWTIIGTTKYSRTYEGKETVLKELLRPLRDRMNGPIRIAATRFLADEDCVVVEAR